MINRLIEFSIAHRWFVIAATILVAAIGVWCVFQTPIDAIPDLSESQVILFADWAGHAPQEVEDQISRPLTIQLQGLPGVRVVRSSSDFGYSMVHVIFEDDVDILAARKTVSEQLASARLELPPGVEPYLAPEAPATGQIFWYVVEGAGYDLGQLRDIQDARVKPQLASVAGVAEVASVGGFTIEYHIVLDPQRLAFFDLTMREVLDEVAAFDVSVGGNVLQSPTAEYILRVIVDASHRESDRQRQTIRDLENLVLRGGERGGVRLGDVARVSPGPAPRRGVLEQDGREVVGGVLLMRYGENPVEVVRRIREKIIRIQTSLPPGVRIVTSYDRTPLIYAAIRTLSTALIEAILAATLCVILVMRHVRTSFVASLTLPLSILFSFVVMAALRALGIVRVDTNIMSLAGLVISIGVLVDSSIVMSENVMHTLHERFGTNPVRGDVRAIILPACQMVGRPIFFSILIMFLSFLPVFSLGGLEGKMFQPLALTKSFALAGSAIVAITLVPALCSLLVRGRLRGERENWLVRSLIDAYQPVLNFLLDRPAAMAWIMAVTFVIGLAPLGHHPQWLADRLSGWTPLGERPAMLLALCLSLVAVAWLARHWLSRSLMFASLIGIALACERVITPLSREFIAPLDEQTVMDMPITVPRASVAQAADDLICRDMILCRFPEVEMVMGKAGRAETPTDPAPIDMIETMVSFRPFEWWPRRKLSATDAARQIHFILDRLVRDGQVARSDSLHPDQESVQQIIDRFDRLMCEFAYQRNQEHLRALARDLPLVLVRSLSTQLVRRGELSAPLSDGQVAHIATTLPADALRQLAMNPALERVDEVLRFARLGLQKLEIELEPPQPSPWDWIRSSDALTAIHRDVVKHYRTRWRNHVLLLNQDLSARGPGSFVRVVLERQLPLLKIQDEQLAADVKAITAFRAAPPKASTQVSHHGVAASAVPNIDPLPKLDGLQMKFAELLGGDFPLSRADRNELVAFGGELDRAVQMPGWTNVWTRPIQNRVDMLATGVNTTIGVRVLGDDFNRVISASEQVAEILKQIPGATNVIADPIRGKGYLTVRIDSERAARCGVRLADANSVLQVALGGTRAATIVEGSQRRPVRVTLPPDARSDLTAIRKLRIPRRIMLSNSESESENKTNGETFLSTDEPITVSNWVTLDQIADVQITDGPASIKGENGLLRNYVRLNVQQRDALDFVTEAQRIVEEKVKLPEGVLVEWTGQFEHQERARRTLTLVFPIVVLSIFIILYVTYRDFADALLMLTAVPGAIAGGLITQWMLGYKLSVTVWVGYIACFGMATSTGIIMLVYLRNAIHEAGGLETISLAELRAAIIRGAVHRLRPKLLTEATTLLGLVPMLWATGVGAEVIRPMAAPVIGGILVADEVIDLFIPVVFYWVRRARWLKSHRENDAPIPASETEAILQHSS